MFRLRLMIAAALVLALGASASQASAQQQIPQEGKEVVITGIGSIIAGDKAKARDDAVDNALRNAVQQVVGTHVESETLTDNFMLVEDRILTQTTGYISRYEVINEMEESDQITVTVRAVVKESDLVSDLEAIGLLLAQKDYPRLLVLVDEQVFVDEGGEERAPTTIDNQTTATALMELLSPNGFRFVDPAIVRASTESNVLMSALEGNAALAVQIGRDHQAEVVVLGKTVAKRGTAAQRMLGSMVSMQASVNLQAYRADTGEHIAAAQETQAQLGGGAIDASQRAIRRAMDRLGPRLEEMILEVWRREVTSGQVVELVIINELGFADVRSFVQLLPYYVRGAQDVTRKSYAARLATLELRFRGGGMALADELSSKVWEEFEIEIMDVTANRIRVRVTPKEDR